MPTHLFSPGQLRNIVDETLKQADIPQGHKNAIVGTVDVDGAQVVAGFKLGANDRWQFQGAFRHDWSGANTAAASVVASW